MIPQRLFFLVAISWATAAILAPPTMFAQDPAGRVVGRVVDQTGSLIPAVSLHMEDTATHSRYTGISQGDGGFVFPIVPFGRYTLTATKDRFQTVVVDDIEVSNSRTTDVTVKMRLGSIDQKMEVTASAPLLETTSNTISMTITPKEVQDLPLNGRDALKFMTLAPGYVRGPANFNGNRNGNEVYDSTLNNLPGAAMRVTLDGIADQSQKFRTQGLSGTYGTVARLESIEEVTVSTSEVGGGNGGQGAGIVQFTTKRGGNQYHGQAFWQHRNAALNANSWLNDAVGLPIGKFIQNDFGVNLGGPILKDKLFFFANFSQNVQPLSNVINQTVLTPEASSGIFRYQGTDGQQHTVNVLQMAAAQGFPGSVNPFMAAAFQKVNAALPLGALASNTLYNSTFLWNAPVHLSTMYPTARFDWTPNQKIRVYAIENLNHNNNTGAATAQFPGPGFSDQVGNNKGDTFTATPGFTWTINPSMVNDFKVGWTTIKTSFAVGAKPVDFSQPLLVGCAGLCSTGLNPTLPQTADSKLFNLTDTFNFHRGTHSLSVGGSLTKTIDAYVSPAGGWGNFGLGVAGGDPVAAVFSTATIPNINPNDVGIAANLYGVLTGRITGVSSPQGNQFDSKTNSYRPFVPGKWDNRTRFGGVYAEDSWRLASTLTLNYGLRWDFVGDVFHVPNIYSSPGPIDLWGPSGVGNMFKPGTLTGPAVPQDYQITHLYKPNNFNPAPHVGVAWSPRGHGSILNKILGDGKTVIRTGFAVNYFTQGTQNYDNAATGLFNAQNFSLNPGQPGFNTAGDLIIGQPLPPFVLVPSNISLPQPQSNFTFNTGASFFGINPNIKNPHIEEWSFGIQREVSRNTVLEARYVGNRAVNDWLGRNINEVNIFENGFLPEFQHAQANLAINAANGFAGDFGNHGLPGQFNLPIFASMFQASGSRPALTAANQGFHDGGIINALQLGNAGGEAAAIAGNATFFCRMVGASFSPCASRNYTGPGSYPINFFQVNPYRPGGQVLYTTNGGGANYNSLQIDVRRRSSQGLTLSAHYAYSKGLGDDVYRTQFNTDHVFTTNRNEHLDYGPTVFDIRHAFSLNGTYDLPFGRGRQFLAENRWLNPVIGGWTLGAITQLQSGSPFRIRGGATTVNGQDSGIVLNGLTVKQLQSNVGVYETGKPYVFLFNPTLLGADGRPDPKFFGAPTTAGQFGQFVYLYGPKFVSADLAATKRFAISEKIKGSLQAEFLNAFNHPNFILNGLGGGLTNTTFGRQTATADAPRQVQLRLNFEY